MTVVVGLRNPGDRYRGTRHNVGAEVVAAVAGRFGVPFRRGPLRVRAELAEHLGEGALAVLALPFGYMNEAGRPVRSVVSYFKAEADELLVVHDDIDLGFGRLRVQIGGGSGGHNGIRSVESVLGTKDFARLKVGVGRPPERMDPADYVLSRFAPAEREEVDLLVEDAAEVVERFLVDRTAAQEMAAHRRSPRSRP